MLSYEANRAEIDNIFKLINSGRFYSLTFVKKGDGQIRYLNGHRYIYKTPDGQDAVVKNVGYDPKNYNLIRIWDRNAVNYRTKEKKGDYRSAALENIIYIKSGNDVHDFVEENQIMERFPYINEKQLQEIRNKMKIEGIVDDEAQNLMNENEQVMGIPELAEMLSRMGGDREAIEKTLIYYYRKYGDEGVLTAFKSFGRGVKIKALRNGRYVMDYGQQTVGANNYGSGNIVGGYDYKHSGD